MGGSNRKLTGPPMFGRLSARVGLPKLSAQEKSVVADVATLIDGATTSRGTPLEMPRLVVCVLKKDAEREPLRRDVRVTRTRV